ncbi:MAG TPA: crossover junction endodeoxyribonuclease RuvC [Aggregatilineales bacterium]|nr:crossover junction endodeoxyribonuclease RuvC [Chloroflexota bacterium]HOA23366.1 crossover junction endodeoxyribonuclease RuvC [Aggregatilineales bacterium]HPV06589.1 crossover junction endodeoxyribonuclease RuvC [Aggregatilineales bacterium]HQA69598.1 crossover junction endodeoxyribonuclease RuvC [Aggregatilineales bacterium]
MLVLGIDPGIAITGYGLVREVRGGDVELVAYGAVETPAHTPLPLRLQQVYKGVREVVEQYRPESAAIEKLLFGKNVTTAMAVGQARGVAVLALADCGLTIAEYTPASIKQAVAGYGNASKSQMQEMVRMLLGLDEIPRPDDAADALAVAITHLHSSRYQQLYDEQY